MLARRALLNGLLGAAILVSCESTGDLSHIVSWCVRCSRQVGTYDIVDAQIARTSSIGTSDGFVDNAGRRKPMSMYVVLRANG